MVKIKKTVIEQIGGLKVKNIVKNLTGELINSLSKNEALEIAQYTAKYSQRRRRLFNERIKETGILTKASAYAEYENKKTGELISYETYDFNVNENMSLQELKEKIRIGRNFLKTKTSNVSGWQSTMRKFAKRIQDVSGMQISENKYKELWSIYNKLNERIHLSEKSYSSTQAQKDIYSIINGNISEDLKDILNTLDKEGRENFILNFLEDKAKNVYEENIKENNANKKNKFNIGRNL